LPYHPAQLNAKESQIPLLSSWISLTKINWDIALADKNFGLRFTFNLLFCFTAYMILTRILIAHRFHPGVVINDPLFNHLKSLNFSGGIFFFTYASIFSFLYYIIPKPVVFYYAVRGFLALFALRCIFIFLMPLQPSPDVIALTDPFTDKVIGFHGQVLNDLFFSGHIGDCCYFVFCCRNKTIRNFLIVAAVCTSLMLVWQKAHYTADVLAAPFFAYGCYVVFVKKHLSDR
jgi:hypothetical protein